MLLPGQLSSSDESDPSSGDRMLGPGAELSRDFIEALSVAVYTTDAEGHILMFNKEAERIWGRRPEIGRDLWCGSWKIFSPDGTLIELAECPMAVALQENRPIRDVEIIVERPDGSRTPILPHPTPLRDETGRLVGAVNVLVDISESKTADETAVRLAAIVENSSDAIISKTLDGTITSWNPGAERTYGYTAKEAIGQSIELIVPEDRLDEEADILRRLRAQEHIDHYETARRRKDGTEVQVSLTISPIADRYGQISRVSTIARDISQRKAYEEALRQSLAVKDQSLGLVSHELRTPIATILGNASLLLKREDLLRPEDRRQSIADIMQEAVRLQENLEQLLAFTRLEVGEVELEPLSLPALVTRSLDFFRNRHPARQISFASAGEVPPVRGQETLVTLVLQNLLSNADKYSEAGEEIEVALDIAPDGLPEIRVIDNGIGLDEQDLANLFSAFYRSSRAKAQAKGLGLGLAVCKRAIEVQGGRIAAAGRPAGGSEFSFALPLA